MKIAFDCDGTLIDSSDNPRVEIIAILNALMKDGHEIIVWSGGGASYADMVARRLKLSGVRTCAKPLYEEGQSVDIAFDDMDVYFGKVNIRV